MCLMVLVELEEERMRVKEPRTRQRCRLRAAVTAGMCAGLVLGVAADAGAELRDRGYELLTPANTGVTVGTPGTVNSQLMQATPDGSRVIFGSTLPLPVSGSGALTSYLADRASGRWALTPLNDELPLGAVDGSAGFPVFAAPNVTVANTELTRFGLSTFFPMTADNTRVGAVFGGGNDLYAKTADGPLHWVTRPLPGNETAPPTTLQPQAATAEGGMIFRLDEPEDPDHPAAQDGLYQWRPGAATPRLVGIDENGDPLAGASLGAGSGAATRTAAASADGQRIVFTANGALYVRVGSSTIPIAGQTGPAARYVGAADDTHRVFFVVRGAIAGTGAPANGGLYAYDVPDSGDPADGELTFLLDFGPGAGGGVVALAPTGDDVYYVRQPAVGRPELRHHDVATGQSVPVTELVADDGTGDPLTFNATDTTSDIARHARVSADGKHLVFGSRATDIGTAPYDNGGLPQLFVYHAGSGVPPACVSCRFDGQPSSAAGMLNEALYARYLTRNVSNAGEVFFTTTDPLVATDTNGYRDVYESDGTTRRLLSGGKAAAAASFVDASEDGEDVFLAMFDAAGVQRDGSQSLFDVRVGAVTEQPVPRATCEGDACQPPAPGRPATPAPGTPGTDGNLTPPPATAPPARRVALPSISRSALRTLARRGSVRLTLRDVPAGRADLRATARSGASTRTMALGSRTLSRDAEQTTITLKLTPTAKRALRRRALKVRLTLTHSRIPRDLTASLTIPTTRGGRS